MLRSLVTSPIESAASMYATAAPHLLSAVISAKSRWTVAQVTTFLDESTLPMRVSSLNAKGFPHITSLWFRHLNGRLYCCTQQDALVCRHLQANPKMGFEVAVSAPPYYGISGQGVARILREDAGELLGTLADRYLAGRDQSLRHWLLSRLATEVIVEITPLRVTSWDFRRRMSGST